MELNCCFGGEQVLMHAYNYEKCPQGLPRDQTGRNLNYIYLSRLIPELLRRRKILKILEIGAGGGRNLSAIHERFADNVELFGTDISITAITYAESLKIGKFMVSRSENIPFIDKFDLILLIDILEHLESRGYIERTLRGAISRLNAGGCIYISIPTELNRLCLTWFFSKLLYSKNFTRDFFGHTVSFSTNDFMALLKENSLDISEVFYSAHFMTQLQMLLFFYVPKVLLRSLFGDRLASSVRDSNQLLGNNPLFFRIIKRLVLAASLPMSYAGFFESVIRKRSPFACENTHLVAVPSKKN